MVGTFNAAVTTRGVGACRNFVYTDKFVNGCRRLGAACSQPQCNSARCLKGLSCGASVAIRGSDLQDRGRYGREWSNWGLEEAGFGRGEA